MAITVAAGKIRSRECPVDGSAEELAIVRRIFVAACYKFGSAANFASFLDVSHAELNEYLEGAAMPPDLALERAVSLILEELPALRGEFSVAAWSRVFPAR